MAEYIEYLRGQITMAAGDAYEEETISTPVGRANKMAMIIHNFSWELHTTAVEANAAGDELGVQVSGVSKTAESFLDDADIICKHKITQTGISLEPLEFPKIWRPPKPLLYAKSQIHVAVINVATTALAGTIHFRFGYTIRFVSPRKFMEALVD